MTTPSTNPAEYFDAFYRTQPADGTDVRAAGWDIGQAQPLVEELENAGAFGPRVLDAGCGTGENVLYLTTCGHRVTGIDGAPTAIEHARAKAARRGIEAEFAVADACELSGYDGQFDSVLDSGLFHTLGEADRIRYVAALHRVSVPGAPVHILAVSSAAEPGPGPRRITETELRESFATGWTVEELRPATMLGKLPGSEARTAIPAWLFSARRLG
ncbi:class I SAM-dependent methyltransferase [Nocardia miyunensis]|uniref:class I SAM-dependent methyltransferase n=1 Tax=Nocardia miyunensis TaxID=282684 RepID=UPI000835F989|nr:class I SAM-dependent methyltransferase [Nocardia miyunensis]